MTNLWSEWAKESQERVERIQREIGETTKDIARAYERGDPAFAKTWATYLKVQQMFLESAKKDLMKERDTQQITDAESYLNPPKD